jgi:hypothetical protein
LEVVEDRHGLASTIVATRLLITNWHENIREPTIADAILIVSYTTLTRSI